MNWINSDLTKQIRQNTYKLFNHDAKLTRHQADFNMKSADEKESFTRLSMNKTEYQTSKW